MIITSITVRIINLYFSFQSAELIDSCFRAPWYEYSSSVQKYFIIIRERCKRPIVLTAGGFFTLDLQMFKVVCIELSKTLYKQT